MVFFDEPVGTDRDTTYVYDGEGRRVRKMVGGSSGIVTTYVYNVSGQLLAEYGGTAPDTPGTRYLTADHLGSTRVVTGAVVSGSDGGVLSRHDYLPFGEEILGQGGRTTALKYSADSMSGPSQKFTGKERDNESGLDFFGARYFGGAGGRFTSVDPENAGASPADPQSWNGYAYTLNNPLRYVDPLGLYASPAYYCVEGNTACLNDDQRRILDETTVTHKGRTFSGAELYGSLNETQQNVFVNVTDQLASIELKDGATALSQITGAASGRRDDVFGRSSIHLKTSTGLKDQLLNSDQFSNPWFLPSGNLRSTKRALGGLEMSFDGQPAGFVKADIDIGNFAAGGLKGVFGGAVHLGELFVNDAVGFIVEKLGGKRPATDQDTIRNILVSDPEVRITPSPNSSFNRRR